LVFAPSSLILTNYYLPLSKALESTGMIEETFKTFGKHSFQHAIFYSNQDCLRFELSEGAEFDSRISMFQTALTRTTDVLNTVFEKSDKVSICFAFAGDSFIENLSQFKEIKSLGFIIPKKRYVHSEWDEEEEWHRNYIFFTIDKSELHKLLFGCLANELGISPSFWFSMYVFDVKLGVLAHPYDDRGMDLVGPNKLILRRIYKHYNSWLLNYDLPVMRQWFGAL
jgi:hypothetical protein